MTFVQHDLTLPFSASRVPAEGQISRCFGGRDSHHPLFAAGSANVTPLSHQWQPENGGSLPQSRVEHDLAGDLARFHEPMRLRSLRERHDALDLWLDLALDRRR